MSLFDAERVPALIFVYLADGTCSFRSRRYYDLTGLNPASKTEDRWGAALHPDDLAAAWERWQASVLLNAPFEYRYRLGMADGGFRWYLERAEPHYDDAAEAVIWYGIAVDIDGVINAPPFA